MTTGVNFDVDGAVLINAGFENASFESSAIGWHANNLANMVSYTRYTDPSRAHDGFGFLEMNTRTSSGSIAQDAPITPWNSFQTFAFSVWIRAAPGTNAVSGAVALSVVELGVVTEVAWTDFTVGQNWTQVTVLSTSTTSAMIQRCGLRFT